MRRVRSTLLVLSLLLVILPTARGGEPDGAAHGLSDDVLADLALSDLDEERALAAQALRQSDASRLERVFELVRQRAGLVKPETGPIALLDLAKERLAQGGGAARKAVPVITVAVRVFQMPRDLLATLEEGVGLAAGDACALLDDTGREALLRAVEKREDVQLLTAPRLSLLDGQAGSLSVLDQVAYVSGFRLERKGDVEVADPQIGVLREGLVLRLEGRTVQDGRFVDLATRATWADLVRPLPVFEGRLGRAAAPVQVQHPTTRFAHVAARATVPDGGTLLFRQLGPGGVAVLLLAQVQVGHVMPGAPEGEPEVVPVPPPGPPAPQPPTEERRLVQAEVRVIDVPVEDVAAVLGASRPRPDRSAVTLDVSQVEALLARVEASEHAKVVSAPRVSVFDGQRANVSILQQISYVADYEVEIAGGGSVLGEPIVETVQEGLVLDLQPTLAEGGAIALDLEATFAALQRPIAETTVYLDAVKRSVTIQLPEVEVVRTKASVRLPAGHQVLVGGGGELQQEGGRRVARFVLIRLDALD